MTKLMESIMWNQILGADDITTITEAEGKSEPEFDFVQCKADIENASSGQAIIDEILKLPTSRKTNGQGNTFLRALRSLKNSKM